MLPNFFAPLQQNSFQDFLSILTDSPPSILLSLPKAGFIIYSSLKLPSSRLLGTSELLISVVNFPSYFSPGINILGIVDHRLSLDTLLATWLPGHYTLSVVQLATSPQTPQLWGLLASSSPWSLYATDLCPWSSSLLYILSPLSQSQIVSWLSNTVYTAYLYTQPFRHTPDRCNWIPCNFLTQPPWVSNKHLNSICPELNSWYPPSPIKPVQLGHPLYQLAATPFY